MNPIASALTQGFSNQSILQYLLRHFPHARRQIEKGLAQGFSADKIVKYLQGGRKEVNQPITEHEQTRQSDKDKQRNLEKNIVKGGLAIGGAALGSYALSRALPRAGQALTGQLLPALPNQAQIPHNPRLALPGAGQAPIQPPPATPQGIGNLPYSNPSAQSPRKTNSQNPITSSTKQESIQTPIIQQNTSIPKTNPIETHIAPLPQPLVKQTESLLQAGNDVAKVAGILKSLQPQIVKDYEKTTGQPIDGAVEEFAQKLPPKEKPQANIGSNLGREEKKPDIPMDEKPIEAEIPKKEKGSTVALPNGDIGEITNIRQGIATVNSQGKEFRRKISELIESPINEKELSTIYDDLIKGIEKETGQQVSRAINYVGFNPEEKSLIVNYTGAGKDTYTFEDLDESRIKQLMELEQMRRTTGQNYVGGWEEGTKSILGSKIYDLVKELEEERGGKGKAHAFTYKTLYDALEPAKFAKEQAYKNKSKAEKEKKIKEKESKILQERFDKIAKKQKD
jgi:hypothetical protein